MTILELPEKLPNWIQLNIDNVCVAKWWADDCEIETLKWHPVWCVTIREGNQTQGFAYADAIRRK